jgi:hypothetical protein
LNSRTNCNNTASFTDSYIQPVQKGTLDYEKKSWDWRRMDENGFKLYLHQQQETPKTTSERQRASSGTETRGIKTEIAQTTDKQTNKEKREEFCSSPLPLKSPFFPFSLVCRAQISKQFQANYMHFPTNSLSVNRTNILCVTRAPNCRMNSCVVDSKRVQDQHLAWGDVLVIK